MKTIQNIKLTVQTDEQNQYVLKTVQKMNSNYAWSVYMVTGCGHYYHQRTAPSQADCSLWKGFRYLVIEDNSDLILCTAKEYYNGRNEKEITFQEFEERFESKPKDTIVVDGVKYKKVEGEKK